MKLFLDHDRTPTGYTILHQSTFFSRDIEIPDKLADRIEKILDAAAALRGCLARIYEQPDGRVRLAVAETLTEEMTKICDGVNGDEKPRQQGIEATSSVKLPKPRKKRESNVDTK
jgi:hypothetical protein